MQIYQNMDIGTAKATPEERNRVPHHLVDFLSPTTSYSAEDYRADALDAIKDITSRGRRALFVGGTGLYIETIRRGVAKDSPPENKEVRARLFSYAEEFGIDALWQRLFEVDRESAEKIHKNNVKRVIRALEIYEVSGMTKTHFDEISKSEGGLSLGIITLDFHNRELLYERVNRRVDEMIRAGLVVEVENLYSLGLLLPNTTAYQAIGYKEILEAILGKCSFDEAVENLKMSSRRYAKRQLTWFRHTEGAVTVYLDDESGKIKEYDELLFEVQNIVKNLLFEK